MLRFRSWWAYEEINCHYVNVHGNLEGPGDLDNRIKTLFDGLRMPLLDEIGDRHLGEEPFHCLLQDDALITGFQVDTDRLLTKPGGNIHEVRLVIDVSVKVMSAGMFNMPFFAT